MSPFSCYAYLWAQIVVENILSGEGAVVHEEKLNVTGVLDEESLVARGHHVLGLLVATVTDLSNHISSAFVLDFALTCKF